MSAGSLLASAGILLTLSLEGSDEGRRSANTTTRKPPESLPQAPKGPAPCPTISPRRCHPEQREGSAFPRSSPRVALPSLPLPPPLFSALLSDLCVSALSSRPSPLLRPNFHFLFPNPGLFLQNCLL